MLVEVGQHFDTVLLPRLKKVVYSPDWKDGKPISRNGSTQFLTYIRLESYEDTLDSLELAPTSPEQEDLFARNPTLAEDYRLRYALGEETAGSACLLGKHFADPFAYTLSVVRDGVRSEVAVDLPETFNFLIGLRVASRRHAENVLAITGTDAEGQQLHDSLAQSGQDGQPCAGRMVSPQPHNVLRTDRSHLRQRRSHPERPETAG